MHCNSDKKKKKKYLTILVQMNSIGVCIKMVQWVGEELHQKKVMNFSAMRMGWRCPYYPPCFEYFLPELIIFVLISVHKKTFTNNTVQFD